MRSKAQKEQQEKAALLRQYLGVIANLRLLSCSPYLQGSLLVGEIIGAKLTLAREEKTLRKTLNFKPKEPK